MNAHTGEGAASDPWMSGQPPGTSGDDTHGSDPSHGERTAEESDSLGALLRARREARGLTIQLAAEALHLDPAMVAAIEADRFAALGAPVYARGHLRKYAVVLGLSPEWAIERYEALADVSVPPPVLVPAGGSQWRERSASKLPLWITSALLAAGVAWGVYSLYQERRSGRDVPAKTSGEILDELTGAEGTLVPVPAAARVPADAPQELLAPAAPGGSSPGERSGVAETRPPVAPGTAGASAAPAASVMRLRLTFGGTSWTEVYDATGRQLVFGLGTAETVYEAAGAPPLRVILGYASAVSAQVDGQAIVIPRRTGRNTARFIIAADGSPMEAESSDE